MNDNAGKWLEALRSDEFQQGYNRLHPTDDTYCCLGVACELYRRETKRGRWMRSGQFLMEFAKNDTLMPLPVREWLGLRNGAGQMDADHKPNLMTLNDRGIPFGKIADWIERYQKELFV